MRKETDYMLQHHTIEPSNSDWSSPCVLVPKQDGTFCFCTDFRKLNALMMTQLNSIAKNQGLHRSDWKGKICDQT